MAEAPPVADAKPRLPLLFFGIVLVLLVAGRAVRAHLGVELSAESLRAWVETLGWKAPAIFVGVVTFRQFLILPSWIVLPAGGLAFGAPLGTLLGTAGIVLSASFKFGLARGLGRQWIRPHLGTGFRRIEARVEDAGAWFVAAATGHPAGPMAAVHWAAGLSSIPLGPFLLAVLLAGFVRAGLCSYFGEALARPGSMRFWATSAALLGVLLLPLASRRFRRRAFGS